MKDGVRSKRGKDIIAERKRNQNTSANSDVTIVNTISQTASLHSSSTGSCSSSDSSSSDSGSCD